ncbi:MAG: DNA primase [Patescibacteria group bacterium]
MTPVEQIKEKLDIVEFIRSYIQLQPAGKNFKALCPFHKERTPSFSISPERQTWHCFGACSEGGDIFKFLMKYENLEFHEALKILAEKAGVELKRVSPIDQKQFGVLYEINEAAKEFFKQNLKSSGEAKKYLDSRGLKQETIDEFELGLAPDKWDILAIYLIKKGYSAADIERAGLIFKNERGSLIDRFRNRIMFPLYNNFGKTIGFSGRILPRFETPETGKYVNSPETLIFNKSKILYGFHKTKNHIRDKKKAVAVEGQMDLLMAHQDGVKNIVAVSGTALTVDHLKILKRLADEIIFFFDNDEAGLKAAERSIDLANQQDFSVKLLVVENYKDPAEIAQKSPGLLLKLLEEAKSAMEFYFNRYLTNDKRQTTNDNLINLKNNVRIILGKIKNLTSAIERAHWLKELSLITKIKEEVLLDELSQLKTPSSPSNTLRQPMPAKQALASTRRDLIAERLTGLLMANENFLSIINEHIAYLPNDYLIIIESVKNRKKPDEERLSDKLNLISLHSSTESALDEEKIKNELNELLRQLKTEYFKEKRIELAELIKKAEKNKSAKSIDQEKEISVALEEFDRVSKLIHNL